MNKDRTVLEAKRYGVYSCYVQTPLIDAARKMVTEDISSLVVLNQDGYLAGILTRTDILRAAVAADDWEILPANQIMSKDVVTVGPQSTLLEVARLLLISTFIAWW